MAEEEQATGKCKRCGKQRTRLITAMLDHPEAFCAADTGDSLALRFCDEKTMLRLANLASHGISTGLLFAVQYNGKASEKAMLKAQQELVEITEGMEDRRT